MKNAHLRYVYHGMFNEEVNDFILSFVEINLDSASPSAKIKKRVYHIMVESLQNITRHKENGSLKRHSGFLIQRKDGSYFITTANVIQNSAIPDLREKLETVNKLDKGELKAYYKELLQQGGFSDKGGAGLGLIDIARKSGNKLSFAFNELNDDFSEFYMQAKVTPGDQVANDDYLAPPVKFHNQLEGSGVSFIHQGAFTEESLNEVIKMAEGDLEKVGQSDLSGRAFHILAEMVENIRLHSSDPEHAGLSHPGILALGRSNEVYCIVSGNIIDKESAVRLSKKLDEINAMSQEELMEASQKAEKIGLINMRIRSASPILYDITPLDDHYSFFAIQTNIPLN